MKNGAILDALNVKGSTPLIKACRLNHLRVVIVLIEHYGANYQHKRFDGHDSIEFSIYNNLSGIFMYLLKRFYTDNNLT